MIRTYDVVALLVFTLCLNGIGCQSREELEEAQQRSAPQVAGSEGEIHLTPDQVHLNGILTVPASESSVFSSLSAIGRVTPRAGGEAQVFSPFAGRLIADPVKPLRIGNEVERGQVLAEVEQFFDASERLRVATEDTQLQATIQQAQREVAFRQIELTRIRQLYEGGALPLKQLQMAELNLDQAKTQLDSAQRTRLQYEQAIAPDTTRRLEAIRAPISGTVVAADLTAGAQVDPSKSLVTIVDLTTVWVEVAIHETDLHFIGRSQRARITTRGNPGRVFMGRLVTIGNVVDPANRTVPATFALDNPDRNLKIGMYAEAQVPTEVRKNALTIPSSAVLTEESESFVFVEPQPGIYMRRPVALGEIVGEKTVVKSGLQLGENVVYRGAQILQSEASKTRIPPEVD